MKKLTTLFTMAALAFSIAAVDAADDKKKKRDPNAARTFKGTLKCAKCSLKKTEECQAAGRATSEGIEAAAAEIKADLQTKGMEIVTDIDMDAFRAAGQKAYEVLGITDAKKALDAEMGR